VSHYESLGCARHHRVESSSHRAHGFLAGCRVLVPSIWENHTRQRIALRLSYRRHSVTIPHTLVTAVEYLLHDTIRFRTIQKQKGDYRLQSCYAPSRSAVSDVTESNPSTHTDSLTLVTASKYPFTTPSASGSYKTNGNAVGLKTVALRVARLCVTSPSEIQLVSSLRILRWLRVVIPSIWDNHARQRIAPKPSYRPIRLQLYLHPVIHTRHRLRIPLLCNSIRFRIIQNRRGIVGVKTVALRVSRLCVTSPSRIQLVSSLRISRWLQVVIPSIWESHTQQRNAPKLSYRPHTTRSESLGCARHHQVESSSYRAHGFPAGYEW